MGKDRGIHSKTRLPIDAKQKGFASSERSVEVGLREF